LEILSFPHLNRHLVLNSFLCIHCRFSTSEFLLLS
jgi:hypothetical protein